MRASLRLAALALVAQTGLAPNLTSTMARMPAPVPTSSAVKRRPLSESATCSINSMQPRVVAWVPVPKAKPGSMVMTWRERNFGGVSHGGVTQKDWPTRRGLMKRRQESCQFSPTMTRHLSDLAPRGLRISPSFKNRTTLCLSAVSPRERGKYASNPCRFRTTPGAPCSMRKFATASSFAAPISSDR